MEIKETVQQFNENYRPNCSLLLLLFFVAPRLRNWNSIHD